MKHCASSYLLVAIVTLVMVSCHTHKSSPLYESLSLQQLGTLQTLFSADITITDSLYPRPSAPSVILDSSASQVGRQHGFLLHKRRIAVSTDRRDTASALVNSTATQQPAVPGSNPNYYHTLRCIISIVFHLFIIGLVVVVFRYL